MVVGGIQPSHLLTSLLYVKQTMVSLLSGSGSAAFSSAVHPPDQWPFSLSVLVDGFGFGSGWFHSFAAAGCATSGFAKAGLATAGFEELGSAALGLAVVRF